MQILEVLSTEGIEKKAGTYLNDISAYEMHQESAGRILDNTYRQFRYARKDAI